ncbi:MAG: chromate transporter [Bacteroidaceae bacterium]|nr:chromate transporter [Bacteroidaceae bacterium]
MLLRLFWCFFKIGLFGFGGGMGVVALIQHDVVEKNGWITDTQFTDIVAISQMTPGPVGINAATYVGYSAMIDNGYSRSQAIAGSLVTSAALILPSFILMILISVFFLRYKDNARIKQALGIVRMVIAGLFIATVIMLCNSNSMGTFKTGSGEFNPQFAISVAIGLTCFYAGYYKKMSPITVVAGAGIIGWVCYGLIGV